MKLYFPYKTPPPGSGPFVALTMTDGVVELDDRNPNTPDLKDYLIADYGASLTPFPEKKAAPAPPPGK